jgi:hypothetical protein
MLEPFLKRASAIGLDPLMRCGGSPRATNMTRALDFDPHFPKSPTIGRQVLAPRASAFVRCAAPIHVLNGEPGYELVRLPAFVGCERSALIVLFDPIDATVFRTAE